MVEYNQSDCRQIPYMLCGAIKLTTGLCRQMLIYFSRVQQSTDGNHGKETKFGVRHHLPTPLRDFTMATCVP